MLEPLGNRASILDGIHVLDGEILLCQQFPSVLQKKQAVRALPFRIVIRKMLPDIAQSRRSKERITKRMRQHISIRVTRRPLVERQFYPANNQFPPSF